MNNNDEKVKVLLAEVLYNFPRQDWIQIIAEGRFLRVIWKVFLALYFGAVYFSFVIVPRVIARALIGDTDWKG